MKRVKKSVYIHLLHLQHIQRSSKTYVGLFIYFYLFIVKSYTQYTIRKVNKKYKIHWRLLRRLRWCVGADFVVRRMCDSQRYKRTSRWCNKQLHCAIRPAARQLRTSRVRSTADARQPTTRRLYQSCWSAGPSRQSRSTPAVWPFACRGILRRGKRAIGAPVVNLTPLLAIIRFRQLYRRPETVALSQLVLDPPSDVTELFQRYDTTLATLLDKHAPWRQVKYRARRGARCWVSCNEVNNEALENTDDNVPDSESKHGEHCSATSVLSLNRSSLITGRTPLTHVTVTRRPYGPSCGRCYSHSLITLLASQLTTTRNTSRRRSIAFAHRQRHHCRPQSTSATFLSYFLPGGRQPSKNGRSSFHLDRVGCKAMWARPTTNLAG